VCENWSLIKQKKKECLKLLVFCVCVRERGDGDNKTLMLNDSPNSGSYCGACGMMGYCGN